MYAFARPGQTSSLHTHAGSDTSYKTSKQQANCFEGRSFTKLNSRLHRALNGLLWLGMMLHHSPLTIRTQPTVMASEVNDNAIFPHFKAGDLKQQIVGTSNPSRATPIHPIETTQTPPPSPDLPTNLPSRKRMFRLPAPHSPNISAPPATRPSPLKTRRHIPRLALAGPQSVPSLPRGHTRDK